MSEKLKVKDYGGERENEKRMILLAAATDVSACEAGDFDAET